ncbi:MAG TPA: helix-turn-helix domain-containing protein [Bryobacteraceae bacterium]|nr:helix-turn-helix domain-containing protein [Bryobacteraceae bacterium]
MRTAISVLHPDTRLTTNDVALVVCPEFPNVGTVYRFTRTGKLPVIKDGKKVYYTAQTVRAFLRIPEP